MPREIKFRAFSDRTGMWSWEQLTQQSGGHPLTCLYSHDGWQVMQFTGVTDKNGVEIYEGDIIRQNGPNSAIRWIETLVSNFAARRNGDGILLSFIYPTVEVIGNIHENPELLQEVPAREPSPPVTDH